MPSSWVSRMSALLAALVTCGLVAVAAFAVAGTVHPSHTVTTTVRLRRGRSRASSPWVTRSRRDPTATVLPFPDRFGKDLSARRGGRTIVDNLGVSGMDSSGLLDQLDDPHASFDAAVARADIVLVTIGANDFASDHDAVTGGECLTDGAADCTADELAQMKTNVTAILGRIHDLRHREPATVLVTGYWNVFEAGDVARSSYPPAGNAAAERLTHQTNRVLRQVTLASGDTYVDLFGPFHGPAAHGNETSLLAADGDHPNRAGHALIARQLVAAL